MIIIKKTWIFLLLSMSLIFLNACGSEKKIDIREIHQTGLQYSSDFSRTVLQKGQYSAPIEDTFFELSKLGTLTYWDREKKSMISSGVLSFLPVGTGVAYASAQGLSLWNKTKTVRICENSTDFCSDGITLFYFDNASHQIIYYNGENSNPLFSVSLTARVYTMLANKDWIVILTNEGTIVYNRENGELTSNIMEPYLNIATIFLYADTLVQIGNAENGGLLFHLDTLVAEKLDIGHDFREHYTVYNCICANQQVFISISSTLLDNYDEELWEGTVKLDCKTWEVTHLSEKYYPNLLCDEKHLYAGNGKKMITLT